VCRFKEVRGNISPYLRQTFAASMEVLNLLKLKERS